jgi:hypothetical protein
MDEASRCISFDTVAFLEKQINENSKHFILSKVLFLKELPLIMAIRKNRKCKSS